MKNILTTAQLDNYSNRKDGSITLRFITSEKTPEEIAKIHSLLNTYGVIYFKVSDNMSKEEIAEIDKVDLDLMDNPKTQSQRLRGVLYRMWEQDKKGFEEWKDFYKFETEKIIEHYKRKLE